MSDLQASTEGNAPIVVGLGEVLWDVFDNEAHFGGAPANFASHAAALGAEAHMVSCVGEDERGEEALRRLRANGVHVDTMTSTPHAMTGVVQVRLNAQGMPSYDIRRDVAWDRIPWTDSMDKLARRAEAVCFGTLAQRSDLSRLTILQFLDTTSPSCLRIFDVNLRQNYYCQSILDQSLWRCNVLKLNDQELPVLCDLLNIQCPDHTDQLCELTTRYGLQLIVLTLGEQGALLMSPDDSVSVRSKPVQVVDTVGAGDSFTATVVMNLLLGSDLKATAEHACRVAAYVCSQHGAIPTLPASLRRLSIISQ